MTLIYKFKKEKLDNGQFVLRPRILISIKGEKSTIDIPALVDSGCDITVIPEGVARALGLNFSKDKDKLYAYREETEVIPSKAVLVFRGKAERESVTLTIPVLIALRKEGFEDESDITLGIEGVFDNFEITFKKVQNKILFKKSQTD